MAQQEIEKLYVEIPKLESFEIKDSKLKLIDKVIQDFAPELSFLYQFREDESEEQQTQTGRLHENRILGIFLESYLEGKPQITTADVVSVYQKYFKELARSTVSNYLNILKRETTLFKEKKGRTVYYSLYREPPVEIKPFWFTRIFCIVPAYFNRALNFAELYSSAGRYIDKENNREREILIRNFKFITGLIILNIFKNRVSKCILCQFSKSEIYKKLEELIKLSIRDRSDVLSDDLAGGLITKCSEIPIFDGIDISKENVEKDIVNEIVRSANAYKKDIEYQVMLTLRRRELKLRQERGIEEEANITSSDQNPNKDNANCFSSKIKTSLSW